MPDVKDIHPSTKAQPKTHDVARIKIVEKKADYYLWSLRIESVLQSQNLWDLKSKQPLDNYEARSLLIGLLSDDILEQVADPNLTATDIWNKLKNTFISSGLSAQSTALTALINFHYDASTTLANKTQLLALKRELSASFNNSIAIDINQLITLIALVNIPLRFQPLRMALEQTANPKSRQCIREHVLDSRAVHNL
jgi:hypothetical protein